MGPIIISENKVGQEALETRTAKLTEEEKYEGILEKTREQQLEVELDEARKAMLAKYPQRKTVETEKQGNSVITWIYINNGQIVTVYKKVEHNWGGVYYFVDGESTNRRYWEHATL